MAPRATIQNRKNVTLKLFQPAEIVPKRMSIRNKIQWRNFKPLPHPFQCAPREHPWSSSLCTTHLTYQHPDKLHKAHFRMTQQYLQLMKTLQ